MIRARLASKIEKYSFVAIAFAMRFPSPCCFRAMKVLDVIDSLQEMADSFDGNGFARILAGRFVRPVETRLPQFSGEPSGIGEIGFTKIGVRDGGLTVGIGELGTVATEPGACEVSIDEVRARQVGGAAIRTNKEGLTE